MKEKQAAFIAERDAAMKIAEKGRGETLQMDSEQREGDGDFVNDAKSVEEEKKGEALHESASAEREVDHGLEHGSLQGSGLQRRIHGTEDERLGLDENRDIDCDTESFHTAEEQDLSLQEREVEVPVPQKSVSNRLQVQAIEEDGDDEFSDWITSKAIEKPKEREVQVVSLGGGEISKEESAIQLEESKRLEEVVSDAVDIPLHREQEIEEDDKAEEENREGKGVYNSQHVADVSDAVEIPLRTETDEAGQEENGEVDEASDFQQVDRASLNTPSDPQADGQSFEVPTLSMHALEHAQSISSIPSENLEDSVSARRPQVRGHSQHNSSHFEEYALPSDLVPSRSTEIVLENLSAPVLKCSDCMAWRGRVEELQLKVESLTAALAAKDIECASLRARFAGKVREPAKSEARLLQECESLRITTEFLVSFIVECAERCTPCDIRLNEAQNLTVLFAMVRHVCGKLGVMLISITCLCSPMLLLIVFLPVAIEIGVSHRRCPVLLG